MPPPDGIVQIWNFQSSDRIAREYLAALLIHCTRQWGRWLQFRTAGTAGPIEFASRKISYGDARTREISMAFNVGGKKFVESVQYDHDLGAANRLEEDEPLAGGIYVVTRLRSAGEISVLEQFGA